MNFRDQLAATMQSLAGFFIDAQTQFAPSLAAAAADLQAVTGDNAVGFGLTIISQGATEGFYNLNLILPTGEVPLDVVGVFANGGRVRVCGSVDLDSRPVAEWTSLADAEAVDGYFAAMAADSSSTLVQKLALYLRAKGN